MLIERAPDGGAAVGEHRLVLVAQLLPADSPRFSGLDEDHVTRLRETSATLPPILVHRQTMRVVDGMHRLEAAIRSGREAVEVEFFDGSDAAAFLRAVEVNTRHGLPLTLTERKAAAARIVVSHPALSDRAIARYSGLDGKTVASIRRSTADLPQLNARRGQDGRLRPVSHQEGRRRAEAVLTERPGASLREVAREAGVSVGTAKCVRDLLRASPAADDTTASSSGARPPDLALVERAKDVSPSLERLRRDPALRLSESGRELLRLLHVNVTALQKWRDLAGTVPPHCREVVAQVAEQYAKDWRAISLGLEAPAADAKRNGRP